MDKCSYHAKILPFIITKGAPQKKKTYGPTYINNQMLPFPA